MTNTDATALHRALNGYRQELIIKLQFIGLPPEQAGVVAQAMCEKIVARTDDLLIGIAEGAGFTDACRS